MKSTNLKTLKHIGGNIHIETKRKVDGAEELRVCPRCQAINIVSVKPQTRFIECAKCKGWIIYAKE